MQRFRFSNLLVAGLMAAGVLSTVSAAPPPPDYGKDVAPILRKYCVGCHNGKDLEGKFNLETYADLMKGGAKGPAAAAGSSESSRMLRMMTKQLEPAMPPDDEPQPSPEEIAVVRRWLDGGAKGPEGAEPERRELMVPKILPTAERPSPVTSLVFHPDGARLAVGRYRKAELVDSTSGATIRKFEGIGGQTQELLFLQKGKRLLGVGGTPGIGGEIRTWDVESGLVVFVDEAKVGKVWSGHRDAIYAAAVSPDETRLATAGYDREILIWDLATGKLVRGLKGHNDAVYDLDFHRDGNVLSSASGDSTVKLWRVDTGVRLDTLSQPTKEQFGTAFTRDGRRVVSTGADNRIRVWDLVSVDKPQINPILVSRFAHEGPVGQMRFNAAGDLLATASEDGVVKLWETKEFRQVAAFPKQPELVSALAFSPDGKRLAVGRMNGLWEVLAVPADLKPVAGPDELAAISPADMDAPEAAPPAPAAEVEPNDAPEQAQKLALPFKATGKIQAAGDGPEAARRRDEDLYRFTAKAGEAWIFEVAADKKGSKLDSKLEILHADGKPVLRAQLQAVRDSYITFRGIDSSTRDVRVFNWEEMELNQFLYFQGEVCKIHRLPRGPDSGFALYPHDGPRKCYFDTSANSHAMHEPCYVVEALPADATPVPNGLPVFPLYYQNDDDGDRKLGKDSRLAFTAPVDGEYIVKLSDVRGFQGEKLTYELTARAARPNFSIRFKQPEIVVNRHSGRTLEVVVDRQDGFDGEVTVDVKGLPEGLSADGPVVVERGHLVAQLVLQASAEAADVDPEALKKVKLSATARIGGKEVVRTSAAPKSLKLEKAPKVRVILLADSSKTEADPGIVTIQPGQTVKAVLRVERDGFDGNLNFEAFNLPFGIIVDNIGLNGVLVREKENEREVQLTAAKWVPDGERRFFFAANSEGNQATPSIPIRIQSAAKTVAAQAPAAAPNTAP